MDFITDNDNETIFWLFRANHQRNSETLATTTSGIFNSTHISVIERLWLITCQTLSLSHNKDSFEKNWHQSSISRTILLSSYDLESRRWRTKVGKTCPQIKTTPISWSLDATRLRKEQASKRLIECHLYFEYFAGKSETTSRREIQLNKYIATQALYPCYCCNHWYWTRIGRVASVNSCKLSWKTMLTYNV